MSNRTLHSNQKERNSKMETNLQRKSKTIYVLFTTFLTLLFLSNVSSQTLQFYQLNYNLDGKLSTNSDWGGVEITFPANPNTLYLNLTITAAGVTTPWQIQNAPLSSIGTGLQKRLLTFDIGNPGINVPTMGYGYTLTLSPIFSPPPVNQSTTVADLNYRIYSGMNYTTGNLNLITFKVAVPYVGGIVVARGKISDSARNQNCGLNECVPAAISNSLQYLDSVHHLNIPDNEISIDSMKKASGWGPDGAPRDTWAAMKRAYMEAHGIPITTREKLVNYLPNLIEELDNNQDVKITIGWVDSAKSFYHCAQVVSVELLSDGKYQITISHDLQQGVAGGTKTESGVYDPATNKFVSGDLVGYDLGIYRIVIECPSVPQPNPQSPSNGSGNNPTEPNMDWGDDSFNPPPNVYQLQISIDSTFAAPLFDSSAIEQTNVVIPSGVLAYNTTYLWRVRGFDSAGPGPWSDVWSFSTISLIKTLTLSYLIQGFYDNSLNNMVSDTSVVYLRNNSSPYLIVDSAKSIIDVNGNGTFLFNNSSDNTPHYIHVKHRNSIETWSSSAVAFSNSILNYDFASSVTQAFGSNMIQVDASPARFAIFSDDVNQDGNVDVSDVVDVYNDANNFQSGYIVTDVNGDNFTDVSDLVITYNNSINFITKITP